MQDTILKVFILKIQDKILSCIFFKILLKSILTKRKILFEGTFHEILFVHCVRYSTRIISPQPLRICIHYKITGMTIILEHKSFNSSESTNTCKTNMAG